ncbi:DENN domain containing protein 2D, putative [Entamoeba invadens IP1]|uniref:DENN domain containing protein 2D, putative n=1 Tax=Entamoeba invadens IP1 TaxID=370355 RepID=A0A0A1TV89_ENTIV|nr:DENN domain containing protein 2D, putative [Entamoeba invadens IP1]ELP84269.1 DENN domain containing protein 2D, putative [Entamoeba invadens IP1]|eukprot:XP_004183615.1 DENN domain containing protein 2D, putative [Entamoeba invadens IP1]
MTNYKVMTNLLIEDVLHLQCTLVSDKMAMKCLYQHVSNDLDQQKTVFPFCFSEGDALLKQRSLFQEPTTSEFFTFTLTDVNGTRKYAYCLRFPHFSEPECICIIGKRPLSHLFEEILRIAEKLRMKSVNILNKFLDDICLQPIPLPNEVLSNIYFHHLQYQFINSDDLTTNTSHDVLSLLKVFGASFLVDLVGFLLVERKFLFVSNSIQTVSEMIMAFMSLITPFQWQHVFIPVLPVSLVTYCSAPMPYVVGVKSNFLEKVFSDCGSMDDTIILNVDSGKMLNKNKLDFELVLNGNEATKLKSALAYVLRKYNDSVDDDEIKEGNEIIYRCFHKYLAWVFGSYKKYIWFDQTKQKHIFHNDEFVKEVGKDSEKMFLVQKFEESQMRFMFMMEREEQMDKGVTFEKYCPLLQDYSTFDYPKDTIKSVTDLSRIDTGTGRIICKFCYEEIQRDENVGFFEGRFYHVNCFRCHYCLRVQIGDEINADFMCCLCAVSGDEKLSDDVFCEKIGVVVKRRNKQMKLDDVFLDAGKYFKCAGENKPEPRAKSLKPQVRYSTRLNKSKTKTMVDDGSIFNEIVRRTPSPTLSKQFIQHKPKASKSPTEGNKKFLQNRKTTGSPIEKNSVEEVANQNNSDESDTFGPASTPQQN